MISLTSNFYQVKKQETGAQANGTNPTRNKSDQKPICVRRQKKNKKPERSATHKAEPIHKPIVKAIEKSSKFVRQIIQSGY